MSFWECEQCCGIPGVTGCACKAAMATNAQQDALRPMLERMANKSGHWTVDDFRFEARKLLEALAVAPQPAQAQDEQVEFERFVAWTERHHAERGFGQPISPRDAWFAAKRDAALPSLSTAAQEQEKDALAVLRAIKKWEVDGFIDRGGFALPQEIRARMQALVGDAHTNEGAQP